MIPPLELLRRHAVLSALDEHFARTLGRIAGETSEAVILAAALAAGRVGESHVCLDLAEVAGRSPEAPEADRPLADYAFPALDEWRELLEKSSLVAADGAPLVLDGTRLYLRRYHRYEIELARQIRRRASEPALDVEHESLGRALRRLFPENGRGPSWQRVAAAVALLRRFTVIAGGPGTGKTWTAARIVALLVEQGLRRGVRARIHLLAPTGKAAARLRESIRESRGSLDCPQAVRAAIPEEASTIHRALGAAPDGSFRYGAERPLVTDAVIVDEASMVDLALMSRLVAAVPDRARIILLGDRDQLASVEAGSVLAELCGGETGERFSRFSRRTAAAIHKLTGDEVPEADEPRPVVGDAVVHLRENRRFQFAIGTLASTIQAADFEGTLELLRSDGAPEISLISASQSLAARLGPFAIDGYRAYLGERDPEKQLEAFGRFRLLCAHRRGADGAESVNAFIENALAAEGLVRPSEPNYAGRPLLVTRNDVSTRLFNGDIGLVVQPGSHAKKALFPEVRDEARSVRLLSLARLPSVETAFALTIHKSQGSEFDEVVVVLPEKPSKVLTRELLYTAVTRARRRVTIIGTAPIVRHAVEHPTERTSGLRERLWRLPGAD